MNDVIIINREGKSKIILNGTPLEGVKEFELKQIGQTGELTLTISIGNLEKRKQRQDRRFWIYQTRSRVGTSG